MFRIRFHGRGGQGMKTAAQILGRAFFIEGYEVQDAPRYGAERRGAPIFAYVRAARGPIHERGAIVRPDLVVVAEETLVRLPAAGVLQGICPSTVLLIRSGDPAETWRERLGITSPLLTLPPGDEAAGHADLPFAGTVCAGAAARLVGIIGEAALVEAIVAEVGGHGKDSVARSLAEARRAYAAFTDRAGAVVEGGEADAADYRRPEWIDPPTDDLALAAPAIHSAATSLAANTGLWRTLRPVIDYEHCNRCSWICGSLCPDSAVRIDADRTPRIDYDHCKGCLVCVTVCPPHAIRVEPEKEPR